MNTINEENSLLTKSEWRVYSLLSEAYNAFIALERLHQTDNAEFAQHINILKAILMSRIPGIRDMESQFMSRHTLPEQDVAVNISATNFDAFTNATLRFESAPDLPDPVRLDSNAPRGDIAERLGIQRGQKIEALQCLPDALLLDLEPLYDEYAGEGEFVLVFEALTPPHTTAEGEKSTGERKWTFVRHTPDNIAMFYRNGFYKLVGVGLVVARTEKPYDDTRKVLVQTRLRQRFDDDDDIPF